LTPNKVGAAIRFQKIRILVLSREGRVARQIGTHLECLGIAHQTHASTLAQCTSELLAHETEVVVAEIHADYSDGLMLPGLLRELNATGRLKRIPHVLWIGEDNVGPAVEPGAVQGPEHGPRLDAGHDVSGPAPSVATTWGATLNGVSMSALVSHARLALAAGIQVQIAADGRLESLEAGLGHLLDIPRSPPPAHAPTSTRSVPSEEDVVNALTSGDGLRVVFQPQYDLLTRAVVGAEVLIRWKHTRYGDVPPAVLIPMVNRLGLDLLLFSYIEKRAIDTLLALDKAGVDIPLAVNASAKTICTPGLAERLSSKMKRVGLPARRLKIELTEEVASVDELTLSASLTALRAKGIQVSLDDFGAGSATLGLLSQMPFDEMKVDGALVRAVALTPASREIIAGIVALARMFNLRLVTEGIEDESSIALLCQLGCRIGQGYALARPMESADFMSSAVLAPAPEANPPPPSPSP
jgi:EAL domain-containing protein (putative c-di-GMP-specific phosphodiesterase class I)